jgi:phage terminase large subunit GpA-like protein
MATPTTDAQLLDSLALLFPCTQERSLISEYVEGRRLMPEDSPFPGPYHCSFTPYAVEIMDSMTPLSPVQHGVMMCSAQIAKTTILENICGYYMDELPSPILFVSGTESGSEKWATTRLEPMIDSLGFRHKIGPQYNGAKSRKSGDKVFEKLFLGGSLHVVSAQSPGDLASMSKRILLRDEIDRAPPNLRSGEGNWLSVSEARTKAWRYRKKIFDCSTPGDYDMSEINRLYEMGDCRMYFVPCPHCKHEQVLELGDGKEKGLKQIVVDHRKEVVYVCCECHKEIPEFQKEWMLANGHWRPTKKDYDNPSFASWHINALYSPLGMYSWASVWEKWEIARDDTSQMKAFINLELGLPYREEGFRPDDQVVLGHRGTYRVGTIPWSGNTGVLWITAGMDVQRGKDNFDPLRPGAKLDDGPRLEIEILGHGEDYRSWSIAYLKFYGPVDNPFAGAWEDFYQWCSNPDPSINKLVSTKWGRSDGMEFSICAIFIDSGTLTETVYAFCGRAPVFYPCKGIGWLSEEKLKLKGDVMGPRNVTHYKASRVPGSDKELFEISTNYYKGEFYTHLRIPRQPLDPNPPGYCDFPSEYGEEHFLQLNAETRWKDGSFHPVKKRNEALDARIYAMAAGESFLMGQVKAACEAARKAGWTDPQIKTITAKSLLTRWASQLKPKGIEK